MSKVAKIEEARHQMHERRVAELATRPVDTARRFLEAEAALKEIETSADLAIHEYSITQERPEKWSAIGDLVRKLVAPLRDRAREGLNP